MLTSFILAAVALAHSGGHGPSISGVGPGGGKLAAVILAADAENGPAARAQGVAEWKRSGDSIAVKFWDLDRKNEIAVVGDVKWILLGKKMLKPVVYSEPGPRSGNIALRDADSVELILPSFGDSKSKHVVAFEIKGPEASGVRKIPTH